MDGMFYQPPTKEQIPLKPSSYTPQTPSEQIRGQKVVLSGDQAHYYIHNGLFREVLFMNLSGKKMPSISIRLNFDQGDQIFTDSIRNKAEVIAFKDPKTDLFVAINKDEEFDLTTGDDNQESVYYLFRKRAFEYIKEAKEAVMLEVNTKSQQIAIASTVEYNVTLLEKQLTQLITDQVSILKDLQQQVNLIASQNLPAINEFVCFQNENISGKITRKLPYDNPKDKQLTQEDLHIIHSFLDVYLNEYDKNVLSWYLGAALLNKEIYHEYVSKALIVLGKGGRGKTSLFTGLLNALLTPAYYSSRPSFDKFFQADEKFATSSLSRKRVSLYSEAEFMGQRQLERAKQIEGAILHNFDGLDTSVMKTTIADGITSKEPKYSQLIFGRLKGLHIILTNHVPHMDGKVEEDLTRRFIAITIKEGHAIQKVRQLGLEGKENYQNYLKQHASIFAAYFMQYYLAHETDYVATTYNAEDSNLTTYETQADYKEVVQATQPQTKDKFIHLLHQFATNTALSTTKLEKAYVKKDPLLFKQLDNLSLLNGSKAVLSNYIDDATGLRKELTETYGQTIKKAGWRAFNLNG